MRKFLLIMCLLMSSLYMMAQTSHWTPITGNQYNMTVYGVIVIDDVQQAVTTLELGAFCGEQCRASGFPMEYMGDYVVPLTILSNVASGEVITFKLYDHSLGQELELNCDTTVDFVADAIIIDPSNWFQFVFTTPQTGPANWDDPQAWGGELPTPTTEVLLPGDIIIPENEPDPIVVASLNTMGHTLTIGSGSTLVVTGNLVCDDEDGLVIEDGAQVINESANVKATAKKSITAYTAKDSNGWYLISSSVNGMEIAGSEFLAEIYDLYRYNETDVVWENYRGGGHADFTTFEKGRGYLYANSNGISPAFIGTLNNADVTYQVTAAAASTASRGINIIGNPFPHKIYKGVGGAIDDSNLETGYYELTYAGAWLARTYDVAIQPGQGVLVVAKTSGNLNIAKSNSAATAETASSKGNVNRLTINVEGNGNKDIAYAYFSDGDGLDKLDNFSSSAAQIAIISAGKEYAIAHVGGECETMDIVFKNTKSSYYTITFESIDEFSYLHLIDKITGEDVDMLLENEYKFYATGSEYDDRFMIVCRSTQGVGGNYENETFAYVSNNSVIVNGKGELQVFDIAGRTVMNMAVDGVETLNTLPQGVYVFRMIEENIVKTQKIVVR